MKEGDYVDDQREQIKRLTEAVRCAG